MLCPSQVVGRRFGLGHQWALVLLLLLFEVCAVPELLARLLVLLQLVLMMRVLPGLREMVPHQLCYHHVLLALELF